MNVGGNDAAATRDFAANQLRLEVLALGDVLHLFGDDALRAKCICDILRLPFADAACASRLSIQSARTAMFYPQEKQDSRRARETRIAGCLVCKGNYGTQPG